MRLLILLASIGALVIAKPEKYREKEDFEYSRSSSDDGSKTGYYGAQRGNMGGNYEHAHNMDLLAQHQMSSLVRQVDGELGSGATQRTGSVFTSGNSRGVYGSGMYDLSNLKGRNFDESHSFGGSHSALSSGAASSLGYGHEHASSNSRYSSSQSQSAMESSRYHQHSSSESAADLVHMGGHQAESLHSGLTQSEYDQQAANNYKYYSGNNGYNSNSKYISSASVPAKVYIRPGQTVTIPISSQMYDASHYNAQNSLNSDAEVISSGRVVNTSPVVKHYESSYKYKKEWEKHDTQTFATPTENPFSQNIEHFENLQGSHHHDNFDVDRHSSSQLHQFNSAHSNAFSTGSKLSSSHQSGYHSGLASQSQNLDSSIAGSHSRDYLHQGMDAGNVVENINTRPKHYQSSYSYHKAWERQGDPYVIVPDSSSSGSEVQASQKFTAASENYGHSSSHHGSQYSQSQKGYTSGCNVDCVNGHIRIARSYKTDPENLEQQSQTEWAKVEDLGQQTQEKWDYTGDLTQQQESKWGNQEDLGQKSQNVWDSLENLSQQSQTNWDRVDQQKESNNDKPIVGYKPQNLWDIEGVENVGNRPRYVTWHEFQNLGKQNQNSWNNGNYAHHELHGNHHQNIGPEEQSQKYNNMHNMFNQEFENWKLMQSLAQHLENKKVENYFNSYGNHINSHGGYLSGHRHDKHCQHSQDASLTNTNYHNSWNTYYDQENVHHKHSFDFWNNQYSNGDILTTHYNPHSSLEQTTSKVSKEDPSIQNFWDKLYKIKIDNTLQSQNSNDYQYNVDKNNTSTEQTVNKPSQSNSDVKKNINADIEESYNKVHPVDVGRGDISAEDLTSETISTQQNKNNGLSSSTVIKNKETDNDNFHQNLYKTESSDITTTEDSLDLSVVGIGNESGKNKYDVNNNEKIEINTERHISQTTQQINRHTDYFQHNADQEIEAWIKELEPRTQSEVFGHHNLDQQTDNFKHTNNDQQLEDFGQQHNNDQQLEDFVQQQNTDQQLENFKQSNTDQQSDFGQKQNTDQQLEYFKQPNTDQQIEDFGQKQNTYQQLEDFKNSNTDQQLEDFGQKQNTDQQLEDFKQPNTDQQLEDFSQHQNTDQQLEDFSQHQNSDQQLEKFKQSNTDQQLDDFGRHQNTDQQSEEFKQANTDQQLEDFGQKQNTDQQLEDFKQANTDQQLEDFSQHQNTDQQSQDLKLLHTDQHLEDFSQHQNTDQQLEDFGPQLSTYQQLGDFKQPNTDQRSEGFGQQQNTDIKQSNTDQQQEDWGQQMQVQQLESFGHFDNLSQIPKSEKEPNYFKQTHHAPNDDEQQQQQNLLPEGRSQPHLQAFEEPKTRSLESAIPAEPVTTTEKPGFWKSVGHKFTGAKNTVAGWFKRN